VNFKFYPLRFSFVARDSIYFPAGKPGNILRGAFGAIFKKIACVPECLDTRSCEIRAQCPYARIFEPSSLGGGPSGLADWPRPFVFRASHLDGATMAPGQPFHFDLNLFELRDPALAYFVRTFEQLAGEGLGPRRGCADLQSVWQLDRSGHPFPMKDPPSPMSLPLLLRAETVRVIRVEFTTPTELKSADELASRPEFPVLFARVRDRLSTLRALYGAGPLEIDFKALGERAAHVCMINCDLRQVDVSRRSSRTGHTHSLGGFVGSAEYEGELTEFVPFLEAAYWTGVGRQTVWGKGEIRTSIKT
jgi:hypothetical protein